MCKRLIVILFAIIMISGHTFAQKAGSFIAGFDIGLTAPISDFSTDTTLEAESGFGIGGELRYALLNNFSFGPIIKFMKFGSSATSTSGSISYNFMQYGGIARYNMLDVSNGKLFIFGGGGIFKPNSHSWSSERVVDEPFESSTFFTVGFGLCSNPQEKTSYEFEIRYNSGSADWNRTTYLGDELKSSHNFDFIYFCMKLSFNTGGEESKPRY